MMRETSYQDEQRNNGQSCPKHSQLSAHNYHRKCDDPWSLLNLVVCQGIQAVLFHIVAYD